MQSKAPNTLTAMFTLPAPAYGRDRQGIGKREGIISL